MSEKRLWFLNPENQEVYFIERRPIKKEKLFLYDPGSVFVVFESEVKDPFSVVEKMNFKRIRGLRDVPLLYYDGPWSDVDRDGCGPKVWVLGQCSLGQCSSPWKKAIDRGRLVIAGNVQAGTRLMDRGAKRLFMDIYGELSVDMDSDEFLGSWHEAALRHVEMIRQKMLLEACKHQSNMNALREYLSSARIEAPIDRLRLASVFLGKKLKSFLRSEGYFDTNEGLKFMANLLNQLSSDISALKNS